MRRYYVKELETTQVTQVPGGLLFRATFYMTGGCSVSLEFVPCSKMQADEFINQSAERRDIT